MLNDVLSNHLFEAEKLDHIGELKNCGFFCSTNKTI